MPSPLTHSTIFFTLSCLFLGTLKNDLSYWETGSSFLNILCLFFILTIGISHGSLDHIKGYKLLEKYEIKNKINFYLGYLLMCIFIIFLWFFLSAFALFLFLIVATYHFGKEDVLYETSQSFFKFLLLGSPIILAPLSFHFEETLNIFKVLYVDNENLINILYFFEKKNIFKILLIIFLIIGLYIIDYKNPNFLKIKATGGYKDYYVSQFFSVYRQMFILEKFGIIILNFTCHPLIAFTIYFCFLHSVRHSFKLANELNEKDFKKGFREFLNKALPLTLVTAILFIVCLIFLTNYYVLNEAIYKVIFIGLASLTFPHILLEYLIEKNEK